MYPYKRVVIAQHERGLFYKNRSLTKVLGPGVHRIYDPARRVDVEVYDASVPEFEHPLAEAFLLSVPALVEENFLVVRLGEREMGLVYREQVLIDVLAPGSRRLYWKGRVEVRSVDVQAPAEVSAPVLDRLAQAGANSALSQAAKRYVCMAVVADQHVGLLLVDGRVVRTLTPGKYGYWAFGGSVQIEVVDERLQAMEVQGQEILTKDKVTLRVNLVASYRITDPLVARQATHRVTDHLYRELQFGLRQAFATRTLDVLLENKGQLDQVVLEHAQAAVAGLGITVAAVGVKDLILPGDMRELLNQVVQAEKVAQANVVKRREETAATRSLLNTAKLMDDNPTLLRLKELEALEKVADKVERLTVFGGLDGVLHDTVRIGVKAD